MDDTKAEKKIQPVNIIIPALCVFIVSAGIERFLMFIIDVECNKLILTCITALLSVCMVSLFEAARVKKVKPQILFIILIALAVIYGLAARLFFADDIKGIFSVCRGNILSVINEYYRIHIIYPQADDISIRSLTTAAIVLITPLIAAISGETVIFFRGRITGAVFTLLLITTFMIGRVPPMLPTILITAGLIAVLPASKDRQKAVHEAVTMSLVVIIAVLAAGLVGTPIVTNMWESGEGVRSSLIEYWTNIENGRSSIRIGDVFGFISKGGINDGELGQSRGFSFTKSTQLKVTVYRKPQQMTYIKGFVGGEYKNNKWEIIQDDMENISNRIGYASYENIYDMRSDYGSDSIQIERAAASGKYIYRPYGISEEEYPAFGSRSYYFTFYHTKWDNNTFYQNVLRNTEYENLEKTYREYVYNTYLDIPDTGLERLLEECERTIEGSRRIGISICGSLWEDWTTRGSFKNAYRHIYNRLQSGAGYSIDTGVTPQGEDFIEYFLYEQKEGYCTHFASTAVMMFRMFGFPARYVSGYVAMPEDFEERDNGSYEAVILDDRAHAWVEVYINGTGWVPVEMTPPYTNGYSAGIQLIYAGGQRYENQTQNQPKKDPDILSEDPEDPEGEEGELPDGDDDNPNTVNNDRTWLSSAAPVLKKAAAIIVTAVLAASAVLGLFMIVYLIMRRITWNKFKLPKDDTSDKSMKFEYNKIVAEMFHWIYSVSLYVGIPAYLESDRDEFIKAFEEHFVSIEPGAYKEVMQLAIRANFAPGRMTYDDVHKICSLCRRMLAYEEKNAGLFTKLKIYALRKKWKPY